MTCVFQSQSQPHRATRRERSKIVERSNRYNIENDTVFNATIFLCEVNRAEWIITLEKTSKQCVPPHRIIWSNFNAAACNGLHLNSVFRVLMFISHARTHNRKSINNYKWIVGHKSIATSNRKKAQAIICFCCAHISTELFFCPAAKTAFIDYHAKQSTSVGIYHLYTFFSFFSRKVSLLMYGVSVVGKKDKLAIHANGKKRQVRIV